MTHGFLLDTHVWLLLQVGQTSSFSADVLDDIEKHQRTRRMFLSGISILEVARLVALEQYALGCSVDDFVATALGEDGLRLAEMSPRILIESTRLPGDLHRDPADRILASTARELGLTLVTRDKALLAYAKQGHLNARKP